MGSSASELEREDAFLLCCVHAFGDGTVDPGENRVLGSLMRALDLDSSRATVIATTVRKAWLEGRLEPRAELEPAGAFRDLCRLAGKDGVVSRAERRILGAAATSLGLDLPVAEEILAAEIPAPPAPESGPGPHRGGSAPEVPATSDSLDDAWEAAPAPEGAPSSLAERLGLFWEAPRYYLHKLVTRESWDRRARRILKSIRKLSRRAAGDRALASIRARANSLARCVFEYERQHDSLERYLEGRSYKLAPTREVEESSETTVAGLHRRRQTLQRALDHLLDGLRLVEDRVAAYVLAGPAMRRESLVDQDLSETLEDLELMIDATA